jgi:thiol:disulfide interchange protein DsbA
MARAYFALRNLGVVDRLHDQVFQAIHVENQRLMIPEVFFDWGAAHGLNREKLKDAYNSFTVSAEVSRAKAMARAYQISGVPTLAINGKYITSASMTGSYEKSLVVADELINMESKASKR